MFDNDSFDTKDEESVFCVAKGLSENNEHLKSKIIAYALGDHDVFDLDKYTVMLAKIADGLVAVQPDLLTRNDGDDLMRDLSRLFAIWRYGINELNHGNLALIG